MKVKTTRLTNGVTVVTETMPHLESVALGVWVKSGSRDETAQEHGIAHLLEHMAFKGTHKRSARQIAEEIENVGGEVNAATSTETTAYYARVLKDHVPLAVDILHDILTNSVFDEAELTREKHVILQEIGAANDTPDDVVYDKFTEAAFRDQTIGRPILGTPETVKAFTTDQIRAYLARHYTGDRIVVVAAGAVDHEVFVKLVDDSFGKTIKPTGTLLRTIPTAAYTGGDYRESRDLMDAQLLIGFEGRAYQVRDFYCSQLLANILGGDIHEQAVIALGLGGIRSGIFTARSCWPTFSAVACRHGCSRKSVKSAACATRSTHFTGAFRIQACSAFTPQPVQTIWPNSFRSFCRNSPRRPTVSKSRKSTGHGRKCVPAC